MDSALCYFTVGLACFVAWTGGVSAAEDQAASGDSPVTVGDVFGRYGYEEDKSSHFEKAACKISFNLDQQKFVDKIPELQKIGILNSELTQTKINMMPNSLSLAFIVEMLPTAVKTAYENHSDIDKCQFTQYITRVDDYGNNKRDTAMAFGFSRDLYKKINWDKFQPAKLPKIAPSFRFGSDFMSTVTAETSAE